MSSNLFSAVPISRIKPLGLSRVQIFRPVYLKFDTRTIPRYQYLRYLTNVNYFEIYYHV